MNTGNNANGGNGTRRSSSSSARRRSRKGSKGFDVWRVPDPLPPVQPISVAEDPTALLRSLGAPPSLAGNDLALDFGRIASQSANIAMALAISIDLLADPDA